MDAEVIKSIAMLLAQQTKAVERQAAATERMALAAERQALAIEKVADLLTGDPNPWGGLSVFLRQL